MMKLSLSQQIKEIAIKIIKKSKYCLRYWDLEMKCIIAAIPSIE